MFSAINNIENSEYAKFGRYLHEQHFIAVFLVAFLLHVMGAAIYYIMPQEQVIEVPVRVLNVKLGGQPDATVITSSDIKRLFSKRRLAEPAASDAPAAIQPKFKKNVVEKRPEPKKLEKPKKDVARAALETPKPKAEITPPPKPEPVKDQVKVEKKKPAHKAKPKVKSKVKAKPKVKAKAKTKHKVKARPKAKTKTIGKPKRYVRASQLTAKIGGTAKKGIMGGGSVIGTSNSAKAEIQSRYTQTISLWLNKYKVYPEAARSRGEGGKVILRVRINRQGRVMRYLLEKSSGSEAIDRAITQMVDAANPLPAVPVDYPDRKPYLEFLIPINFIP